MAPDGSFLVVWDGDGQPGDSGTGVFGQRFSSDGTRDGSEFHVNTQTQGNQVAPQVAMAADGRFVVVWASLLQGRFTVHGQRFAPDGSPQGGEFQVNTTATENNPGPHVAMAGDGRFVVVWASSVQGRVTVSGQRFAPDGSPQGDEIHVVEADFPYGLGPRVAMAPDGRFVVVFPDENEGGPLVGMVRFRADGTRDGAEMQVNEDRPSYPVPNVAMAPDGRFLVVWTSDDGAQPDSCNVVARRFLPDGSPDGSQFLLNTNPASCKDWPQLGLTADGRMVAVWTGPGEDADIMARVFDENGDPVDPEFLVNTHTLGGQFRPRLGVAADGRFVVLWVSEDRDLLFAKFFTASGEPRGPGW